MSNTECDPVEGSLEELPVGAKISDCGEVGEVVEKANEDGEVVYTVEYGDGTRPLPHIEAAIGVIDGTIRVGAP